MAENQMSIHELVEPEPWVDVVRSRPRSLLERALVPVAGSMTSVDDAYLAALNPRDDEVRAAARWFRTDHLPHEALHGDVAREFQTFTLRLLELIGEDSVEVAVALRKLLEAKDAAVRAALA